MSTQMSPRKSDLLDRVDALHHKWGPVKDRFVDRCPKCAAAWIAFMLLAWFLFGR